MKKTLIALAVAATAAVSGSAVAWTTNGTGGTVDLGGTLAPVAKVTPWEVKTGAAVTGLDADIQKGQSVVDIVAKNSVLALGIRTTSNKAFSGMSGISPQIDFKNAIDLNGFDGGVTTLTLEVKDETGNNKIGTLTAPFNTAAVGSLTGYANFNDSHTYMYDDGKSRRGFAGGLATSSKANKNPQTVLNALSTEIMANFDAQNLPYTTRGLTASFSHDGTGNGKYSAVYGAGILANDVIKINLDQPATSDAPIAWKAFLPVIVTYM